MNNHSESTDFNNKDFNNECVQFMTGKGFDLDKPFQPDGKFHRFSADDNPHKPDEWYIASEWISNKGTLYLCCTFCSWSSGEQYTYQSWKNDTQLSTEERKEFYEISQKNRADVEIKSKEMYDVKAKEAAEIWETCETEPPNKKCLRYAEAKGVDSTGVRFGKNPDGYWCMIVALKNFKGEIRTL